jgi:hypothetical protein
MILAIIAVAWCGVLTHIGGFGFVNGDDYKNCKN